MVGRGARDKGRIQGREERIGDAVALKPKVFPFVVALLLGSVAALLGPSGPSQRDREIKKGTENQDKRIPDYCFRD